MATLVQSCRIEQTHATLLARQAKRRHLEVSTLSSLYLKEKALEEEYPGIGFRDGGGGREAYVVGHRVAVWEVLDIIHRLKTVAKTAIHFRWPPALVRCALAFEKAFREDIQQQRQAEVGDCEAALVGRRERLPPIGERSDELGLGGSDRISTQALRRSEGLSLNNK